MMVAVVGDKYEMVAGIFSHATRVELKSKLWNAIPRCLVPLKIGTRAQGPLWPALMHLSTSL